MGDDDTIVIFGIIGQECSGEVHNIFDIESTKIFKVFTDLEPLNSKYLYFVSRQGVSRPRGVRYFESILAHSNPSLNEREYFVAHRKTAIAKPQF